MTNVISNCSRVVQSQVTDYCKTSVRKQELKTSSSSENEVKFRAGLNSNEASTSANKEAYTPKSSPGTPKRVRKWVARAQRQRQRKEIESKNYCKGCKNKNRSEVMKQKLINKS